MIDRLPVLWCIPLNVTEACLHAGSVLARRLPDLLSRVLSQSGAADARWAPLLVEVEEGLGYAILGIPPDRSELEHYLWQLDGDYLLYGQMELMSDRIWIESGIYSGHRDEILIEPRFSGTTTELLAWLPEWFKEVAECVGQRGLPWDRTWLEKPVTSDWAGLHNYCEALDIQKRDDPRSDLEWRTLSRVYDSLRADADFEMIVELGVEVADQALQRGEVERAADIAQALMELSPDSPAAADLAERTRRRLG